MILILSSVIGFGQNQNEKILYIVDSIPVIEDPEESLGTLTAEEIDRVEVVKDKKVIASTGYTDLDGIIYLFTKEYVNRPDSIKAIPTTKLMTRKNGAWYLKNSSTSYSGKFIDYYLTGKRQGEGILRDGTLSGKRILYYPNGKVSDEIEYESGLSHGLEKRFYKDGSLMQKGIFEKGKEIGVWEMYHPNGQLKQRTNFNEHGKMDGESVAYYSTGKVQGKNCYKNGSYQPDKVNDKIYGFYKDSQELYQKWDYKGAIQKLNKALALDSTFAEGYFARGTMKLNDFQFEEAAKDFDKVLMIEPFFTNAYSNRAFTIIKKYELQNGRTLSQTKGIQVIATKEADIPASELPKVCADLKKAVELGDENKMVLDALKKYCKE